MESRLDVTGMCDNNSLYAGEEVNVRRLPVKEPLLQSQRGPLEGGVMRGAAPEELSTFEL